MEAALREITKLLTTSEGNSRQSFTNSYEKGSSLRVHHEGEDSGRLSIAPHSIQMDFPLYARDDLTKW